MKAHVFFSWQSDIRAAACRSLVLRALEDAAIELAGDGSLEVEPVIDRDTLGVPGSPDIGLTIFSKIDAANAMVADVTIINSTLAGARPTPNPNVLVELGYALKSLGGNRIVLVQNVAFGGPETLPFDLRQRRVLTYSSAEDVEERSKERRTLQAVLKEALSSILSIPKNESVPVGLGIEYENVQITATNHTYRLVVKLENVSTRRIDDWELEIEFPTPLLDGTIHGMRVPDRSDARRTLFRATSATTGRPLRVGDVLPVQVGYYVNDQIYRNRATIFGELAKARAFVNGELVLQREKPIKELQNF